ncbi:MAG: NAD(+) synthase, partial [Clostridia bacterium]|nr:NAD(+) synthase [Clostridia bacterium]
MPFPFCGTINGGISHEHVPLSGRHEGDSGVRPRRQAAVFVDLRAGHGAYVGYFTKWGDGAHDFNPIADLTVTEIYEFLRYLDAPKCVIEKAPSAALFDGQTDETEMGVTYA